MLKSSFPLLVLLLASCAAQTYAPQPLEPARTAEAFQARTLDDAGLGTVEAWGLPQLTQVALRLHPDLAVARAQWRSALAGKITAGQKPNPTLSASDGHHSRADNISPWTLTLGIDIPIETHGKREARLEQAEALSEAAKLDIAQSAWQVRSRLRSQLLENYAIQQQTALLQQETEVRKQVVALLDARFNAGMASSIDLADARLRLQKASTALNAEAARAAQARAALATSIGVPESALAGVTLSMNAFERDITPPSAGDIQRAALLNRADIRKALANYAATEAKLKLEVAKQYPDISLMPGYSWDQGDNIWSLGLSLTLAILNKNEGPIAEAKAQRDAQAQQFIALQAAAIGEQSQMLAGWLAAHDEIEKAQRLSQAQQERLAQIQHQFDAGYADRLELTTARLELVTAESAVLAARIKAQRAFGQLEDAVQQPLDGSAPQPEIPEEKS